MSMDQEQRINDLVVRIQSGEESLIYELWQEVEQLCGWYCKKVLRQFPESFHLEFGDLYGCGFLALHTALANYTVNGGCKFSSYYLLCLTGSIYKENHLNNGGHYEDSRRRFDPVITGATLRLDAPTNTNQEKPEPLVNVLSNEQLADPATDTLEQIEEQIYQQQLHDVLEGLIDDLPELQQYVIRQKYYSGQDCARIADMLECNRSRVHSLEDQALLQLRKAGQSVGLDKFLNADIDYYSGTGVGAFKNTGSSSTERLAQRRMDMEARFARQL